MSAVTQLVSEAKVALKILNLDLLFISQKSTEFEKDQVIIVLTCYNHK